MRTSPVFFERNLSVVVINLLLLAVLLFVSPVHTTAQETESPERARAFQLYDQNKFIDAIPLLEKVVKDNPSDVVALERLGWSAFVVAGSTEDPQKRKKLRDRALAVLTRAKELGDDSELLRQGLEGLSQADDGNSALSHVKEADAAMREGEAAHAKGDLDKAITGYERAFRLDPKLYLAALFIGDMYFKKGYQATDKNAKNEHLIKPENGLRKQLRLMQMLRRHTGIGATRSCIRASSRKLS